RNRSAVSISSAAPALTPSQSTRGRAVLGKAATPERANSNAGVSRRTSPAASASSGAGCSPRNASVKWSCSGRVKLTPSPPVFRAASRDGRSRSFASAGTGNAKKRRMRYPCDPMPRKSKEARRTPLLPLPPYYQVRTPLASVEVSRKIDLLQQADTAARAYDKRVKQVTGGYADQTREILVANTLGHLAEDRQDLCRLSIQCVAFGKNGER